MRTSRLGFGCAALVGGRTRSESLNLLEAAFEAGIRHYDVARVYGTGDAESIVGEFARRHRDEVTIATKFGISPLRPTRATSALKAGVRVATRRSRRALNFVRRYASASVQRSRFDPGSARRSLAASLDALGVDSVDLLLLHDPEPDEWRTPGLHDLLEELTQAGVVRAYGTATGTGQTQGLLALGEPLPPVFQLPACGPVASIRDSAPDPGVVTYGPLSGLSHLRRHLDAAHMRDLGLDPALLSRWLLANALEVNREGVVVFSASDPGRIAANAALAGEPGCSAEQLAGFRRLVASIHVSGQPLTSS